MGDNEKGMRSVKNHCACLFVVEGRVQNGACGHTYIILLWEIYVAGMRYKNVFFHRDIVKVSQAVL